MTFEERMNRAKLVNVWNDFYPERYEVLKQTLEEHKMVQIYVDCIGHTRSHWVEQAYADKLKQEYGDRLIITGNPGEYGTTYELKEAK